jgi:hypothetical protein
MIRTTFRLDDELLAEAKALAARQHRSLTSVMEEALRRMLAETREQPPREAFRLHIHQGEAHGPQPGVDLDSNAALLDLMEEDLPLARRR